MTQYPSLVVDWGSTNRSQLDVTLYLNNSNLQVREEARRGGGAKDGRGKSVLTLDSDLCPSCPPPHQASAGPTLQRWPAALNLASSAFMQYASEGKVKPLKLEGACT